MPARGESERRSEASATAGRLKQERVVEKQHRRG